MGIPESVSCPWMKEKTTWIDKRGKKREVPMQVIGLGFSRTGTSSTRIALWELGYSVWHGFSMFENPPDATLINEALSAKFEGKGRSWERKDWDSLFYDCSAVVDNPAYTFSTELIQAYPKAKFIMTVRDVDSWYRSMQNTILGPMAMPGVMSWIVDRLDPAMRLSFSEFRFQNRCALGEKPWTLTREQAQRIWDEHIRNAREMAPKERYLEYDVKEGWEPLCKFLDKPVPRDENGNVKPFPHVNDSKMFNELLGPYIQKLLLVRLAQYLLPCIVAAFGVIYWRLR